MHDKPNIILIIGEDTGRDLGCYGDQVAQTPNLDRLANEGQRYDQAYATSPVCAPSRSSIVTGCYPMRIGTHHMRSQLIAPPRTFLHELRDRGYHVNWHTKLDFNFEPAPGWRDADEPWVQQLAAGRMPREPWFAYVNMAMTHESRMWSDYEYVPPDAPASQVCRAEDVCVPPYLPDTLAVRDDIARHYNNIKQLDDHMGQILDALRNSGQADNTYVMFLADHGRGLVREKRWPYPAGIHVPLLIRGPGITPQTVDDQPVSWIDIGPTILSLTGTTIPTHYDGRALLGPATEPRRDVIFAGRDRMDEAFDMVRVCADAQHYYVRNFYPDIPYAQRVNYMERMHTTQQIRRLHAAGELTGDASVFMQHPKPPEELYDRRTDPHCVRNLADDPAYAQVKKQFANRVTEWMNQIDDLGRVDERELIRRGLVKNKLDQYAQRIEPLAKTHRLSNLAKPVLGPWELTPRK